MFLAIARIKSKGLFGRPLLPIKSTTDPDGIVLRWESESRIPKAGLWGLSFRKSYFIQTIVLCLRNFYVFSPLEHNGKSWLVWSDACVGKTTQFEMFCLDIHCTAFLPGKFAQRVSWQSEARERGNFARRQLAAFSSARPENNSFLWSKNLDFYPTQLKSCIVLNVLCPAIWINRFAFFGIYFSKYYRPLGSWSALGKSTI